MTECPFLSTYDNSIECFKECALYNYKATGDNCPFQNLNEYLMEKVDYKNEIESVQKDLMFTKEYYVEFHNQYS
ncbi:hypothetical protein [Clostridium sp. JS66]|uniref:hypothetical protein n=1 Tax=Clostridium sp. JS66 TaxID=3064705 RepID=UPI00298DA342|nr:hypothetical protein [Clostridium sp. JS66]WPC40349.1 hypothetical protein Q6H37_20945 [Clostridium sp. JS66]